MALSPQPAEDGGTRADGGFQEEGIAGLALVTPGSQTRCDPVLTEAQAQIGLSPALWDLQHTLASCQPMEVAGDPDTLPGRRHTGMSSIPALQSCFGEEAEDFVSG